MSTPSKFAEIRPYDEGEVQGALKELLADRQFRRVLKAQVPFMPLWATTGLIRLLTLGIQSPTQFQKRLMKPVVKYVARKTSAGIALQGSPLPEKEGNYLFMSNHRDIVLDSAFLAVLLLKNGNPTTCEIAIGDNLLIYPWIRTLVRINKAFIVHRSLSPREMFKSSQLMSEYIHYAITHKRENIWIAQREGRAKDSDDRTQEAVLKMLSLGAADKLADTQKADTDGHDAKPSLPALLKPLNIVPLTISYEYDPCDYLKAAEFQLKRDNPAWHKSTKDDLTSMGTGIKGEKGRVVYHSSPCINTWLDEYADLPPAQFYEAVAKRIDRNIHQHYTLYPGNYIALDLLEGTRANAEHYTPADEERFNAYLAGQLAKIDIPDRDEAFLRERILTMYANPVRNQRAARKPDAIRS